MQGINRRTLAPRLWNEIRGDFARPLRVRVVRSALRRERAQVEGPLEWRERSRKRRIYALRAEGPARNAARIYTQSPLGASSEFELLASQVSRAVVNRGGSRRSARASELVDRRLVYLTGKPDVQEAHRIRLIAAGIIDTRARREMPARLYLIKKLGSANYTLVRAQSSSDEIEHVISFLMSFYFCKRLFREIPSNEQHIVPLQIIVFVKNIIME